MRSFHHETLVISDSFVLGKLLLQLNYHWIWMDNIYSWGYQPTQATASDDHAFVPDKWTLGPVKI